MAAYYAQIPALETLLTAGSVDNKTSNDSMGVAFIGNYKVAKWLLENTQCDVNHQNYAGQYFDEPCSGTGVITGC